MAGIVVAIDYLRETSPFYIYSNPITPAEAAASMMASLIEFEPMSIAASFCVFIFKNDNNKISTFRKLQRIVKLSNANNY